MGLKNLCTAETADKGIEVDIYHPSSGEPLGIVVTMLGSDSQAFLEADRQIKNHNLAIAKKKRDFTIGMEPEAVESALIRRMQACFVGWKEKQADGSFKPSISFEEGVELESSKFEFARIIANRGFFWLRQQLQEAMDNVSNFLPKAQPSSAPVPSSAPNTTAPEKTA